MKKAILKVPIETTNMSFVSISGLHVVGEGGWKQREVGKFEMKMEG